MKSDTSRPHPRVKKWRASTSLKYDGQKNRPLHFRLGSIARAPGDRQGVEDADFPYDEGVANHIGPKSCAGVREGASEAFGKKKKRSRPSY